MSYDNVFVNYNTTDKWICFEPLQNYLNLPSQIQSTWNIEQPGH